jgi:hypothetical protein
LPPYSSHFFPFKLSLIDSFLLHCHCQDLLQYSSSSLSLSQFTTVFLQLSLSQVFFQLNVIVTIYYSIFPARCHSDSLLQCSSSSLSLSQFTAVIVVVRMYYFSSSLSLSQCTTVFLQLTVIVTFTTEILQLIDIFTIYCTTWIPPAHCHCHNLLQYSSSSFSLSQFTAVFLQLIVIVRIYYIILQFIVIVTIYCSIPPAHCHCQSVLFLQLIVIVTIYYSSSSLSLSECAIPPAHCHCYNLLFLQLIVTVRIYCSNRTCMMYRRQSQSPPTTPGPPSHCGQKSCFFVWCTFY